MNHKAETSKVIILNCPKCAKEFKFKDEHAGRIFGCTECRNECHIPTLQELRQSSAISATVPTPFTPSMEPVLSSFTSPEDQKQSKLMARKFGSWAPRCSVQLLLASLLLIEFLNWNYAPQWDYDVVTPADDQLSRELEYRGNEGWELVSSRRVLTGRESVDNARHEMFFRVDRKKRHRIVVPKRSPSLEVIEETVKNEVRKQIVAKPDVRPESIKFVSISVTDGMHDIYDVSVHVLYVNGRSGGDESDYVRFRIKYFNVNSYIITDMR